MMLPLVVLLSILGAAFYADAAKVLLIPAPAHSHLMEQLPIGEKLATDFKHEVYVLVHRTHKIATRYEKAGIKTIPYGKNKKLLVETKEFQTEQMMANMPGNQGRSTLSMIQKLGEARAEMKSELLTDEVIKAAEKHKFDFMVVDGLFFFRFIMTIPHRLNVPFGCVMSSVPLDLPGQLMKLPSLEATDETLFDQPMTFVERLINTKTYLTHTFLIPRILGDDGILDEYNKDPNVKSLRDLAIQSKFWIVDKSPLLMHAVPRAPNVFVIGGISSKQVDPLETDVKKFADGAKNGFVVVSFGSVVKYLPAKYLNDLAVAFARLPELQFIWRLNIKLDVEIPSNVKTMAWLPQNDLLAHKNAKAFITHCGSNGMTEALIHGVPMVGMPIQFDQPHNCNLMKGRGYGVVLDIKSYTADSLYEAVKEVVTNPSYTKKIKVASAIINTYPNAAKTAAGVVDHVVRFGGEHIANTAGQIYWFQILMWDFAFCLYTIIFLVLLFIYFVIKRCCFGKKKKSKKD